MPIRKQLSNPFSTGNRGAHFEAHVQAFFVTLMLTRGFVSSLPCWPIVGIKFQGKIDGFDTDDLIITVEENINDRRQRKLLGQIKHRLAVTKNNSVFRAAIQAAWDDYNNPEIFVKNRDTIALLTGPLSDVDVHTVPWLLNYAKNTNNVNEFFSNIKQANYSPPKAIDKLQAIQFQLRSANNDKEVSNEDLYNFLRHYYLFSYDLGEEHGVVLSLLHSHLSQIWKQDPHYLWCRILELVQTRNQYAGTVTFQNLPEDLADIFLPAESIQIPDEFKSDFRMKRTDWAQHEDALELALFNLIGICNDSNECDMQVVAELLGIEYKIWIKKALKIQQIPDSPLSLKNGCWRIKNRSALHILLSSYIRDQNLEFFASVAISVLKQINPSFEISVGQKNIALVKEKKPTYSSRVRKGIAETLAFFASNSNIFENCSSSKVEEITGMVIQEIFNDSSWALWASLDNLLPILAEAAPVQFLKAIGNLIKLKPYIIDELYTQEANGMFGGYYITGLLWALEILAWEEQYVVRVGIILGELASRNPEGRSNNRPFNSLVAILLPWMPHTLASIEKRKTVVLQLTQKYPDVGWKLVTQLLPNQHQVSINNQKPVWRKNIPADWAKSVSRGDYWQQISFYAELSIKIAGHDANKLSKLINYFDVFPELVRDNLLGVLSSEAISQLNEKEKFLIWDHLTKSIFKRKKFVKKEGSDSIVTSLEKIADMLAPKKPIILYQPIFNDEVFCEESSDWQEQHRKLNSRRENAIKEIFQLGGIHEVIKFAESVTLPERVGDALGIISGFSIEQHLFPGFFDSIDKKYLGLVKGFIWKRYSLNGAKWCDGLNKSAWNEKQIAFFLACLPFKKETWKLVDLWLGENQREYWIRINENSVYEANDDLNSAVDKFIAHDKPYMALKCLYIIHHNNKEMMDVDQCIRALLAALLSDKYTSRINNFQILELIKFVQSRSSVSDKDLFTIEWGYLPLIDSYLVRGEDGPTLKLLENKLAHDPEFFCEIIRMAYRSKQETKVQQRSSESLRRNAINALRLLDNWKFLPGTEKNGVFNSEFFLEWLKQVKSICIQTEHLEIALITIGKTLVNSPPDPDGLWIHRAIAEVLNDQDAEDMRNGFVTGILNARGVHCVDPSGKPEKELAAEFIKKSEEVEDAGFEEVAFKLRNISDFYAKDAVQIFSEYQV